MTEDKKTLASKLKDHYTENREGYIRFGCYTAGVLAATVVMTVMDRYQVKVRAAQWDAAQLEAVSLYGADAVAVRARDGRFGAFLPHIPQD